VPGMITILAATGATAGPSATALPARTAKRTAPVVA
jgi:hypothetical protein